ncbi:MAG TPA: ethylbenzene dehydrogenase-related protein [Vicinamibacterales bacterium]|nr:ethylbenzene dehydrogenase-related protein [Vicinamibacterales bacterium]
MRNHSWPTVMIVAALAAGCGGGAGPPLVNEVVAVSTAAVPADPDDAVWRRAPVHLAPLILQDLVEPRLLVASTADVRVQAASDGREIAFRLEWSDPTRDDTLLPGKFSDACAVQVPAAPGPDVPAPQMGEPGRAVEISYWRAAWQAVVDGRGDTVRDLYPGATVDHYPFEAASLAKGSPEQQAMVDRYAPARALGNHMAGPRDRPVEDLVSSGPGTLAPAVRSVSSGRGVRTATGWTVVLQRPVPAGFAAGTRAQVAFAVWEGTHDEAGARKMRTGWIQLALEASR